MPKPPGVKPGQTVLRDPALRRARALLILEKKITRNMSVAAIAESLAISSSTVKKEIDWAKREGLVANYEDQILQELVPEAIKTFSAAIRSGDAQAALEVLKGTGLLRKPSDKSTYTAPAAPAAEEEVTLEAYIRKTVRGGTGNGSTQSHYSTDRATGRFIAKPRPALPPAGEIPVQQGDLPEDAALRPEIIEASLVEDSDEDRTPEPERFLGDADIGN